MMRRFYFLLLLSSLGLTSCIPISKVPVFPLFEDEVDLDKYIGHWELKSIAGVEIGLESPSTSVDVIKGVSNSLELLFRTPIDKGFMIEKCKAFLAMDGESIVLSIKRDIDNEWILTRLSHHDDGRRIGLHMVDKAHIKQDILSGVIPGKFSEREGEITLKLTADAIHLREYLKKSNDLFSKDPVAFWERKR